MVAGVQEEPEVEVKLITPTSKTKQISPTVKPDVKSKADTKTDNQDNRPHTNNAIEESVVVTATPTPTSTPTSTPSLSPTPTPDTEQFEATSTRDGNKVIITANRVIADCRYSLSPPSGNPTISSNNTANGTTTCEVNLTNSGWNYGITVKSESGETLNFRGTV